MPLYEYECNKCRDRFEVIQKIDAAPLRRCQKCGGKVRRLISAPAFRFRGSGWYVTDYGKGKPAPSDAGQEKKPSGKKETTPPGSETGDRPAPEGSKPKKS